MCSKSFSPSFVRRFHFPTDEWNVYQYSLISATYHSRCYTNRKLFSRIWKFLVTIGALPITEKHHRWPSNLGRARDEIRDLFDTHLMVISFPAASAHFREFITLSDWPSTSHWLQANLQFSTVNLNIHTAHNYQRIRTWSEIFFVICIISKLRTTLD